MNKNIISAKEAKKQAIKIEQDRLSVIINQLRNDIDNAIKCAICKGETTCTVQIKEHEFKAFNVVQKEFQSFGYNIALSIIYPNKIEIDFS